MESKVTRFGPIRLGGLLRRGLTGIVALAILSVPMADGRAGSETGTAPVLGKDGIYVQTWFVQDDLDLGAAFARAAEAGKRLVVFWERKNCGYCEDTHLINLAVPEIRDFIKANYVVAQVNIWGDEDVVDFDGERLSEDALADKYGVRSTPTFTFYPETRDAFEGRTGARAEVMRMPGYIPPGLFAMMFAYVRDEGYEHIGFTDYVDAKLLELQTTGP